jgi:hypothetical protein
MQGERDPRQSPAAPALPVHERIGLSIVATDAADAVNRIVEAERAGLRQVWLSQGGSGGTDTLTIAAVAAARTTQIRLGTAIVPIYPRHPLVMAQQALVIHDIAPGDWPQPPPDHRRLLWTGAFLAAGVSARVRHSAPWPAG